VASVFLQKWFLLLPKFYNHMLCTEEVHPSTSTLSDTDSADIGILTANVTDTNTGDKLPQ